MSSSFGTILKVTTFGESHGNGVGAILDGCPAGIYLDISKIQMKLDRRRPGQNSISTTRDEEDKILILSGINEGITLGSPIGFFVKNRSINKTEYKEINKVPRPSHADYTYYAKYGLFPQSGGGRSSARETVARVAAGAIAEKFLNDLCKVEIVAWVSTVGNISTSLVDQETVSVSDVDKNLVRCPDDEAAFKMERLIQYVREKEDSIGGVITCVCRNVPIGWGEPIFDKLDAKLAHAMLSIPATKGFEIGKGFACASMKGSLHNDPFIKVGNTIRTKTNNSGGIQGGISTGDNIVFRVAFKPTASIGLSQRTVNFKGNNVVLRINGRHDPCVVPRAVPIVEAMTALVLGDFAIIHNNYHSSL